MRPFRSWRYVKLDHLPFLQRTIAFTLNCTVVNEYIGAKSPCQPSRPAGMNGSEDSMDAAIDRIMQTYDLMVNRTAAASEEARGDSQPNSVTAWRRLGRTCSGRGCSGAAAA